MLKPTTKYDGDLTYQRGNSVISEMESLEEMQSDIDDHLSIENDLMDEMSLLSETLENLLTLKL